MLWRTCEKRFTFGARRVAPRTQPTDAVDAGEEQERADAGEERGRDAREQHVRNDEHAHQERCERPVRLC